MCIRDRSGSLWSRSVWQLVTLGIVIPLGTLVTGSSSIFRYLRQSVMTFDRVPQLQARLRAAGYADVQVEPVDGWQRGIVHSFLSRRPKA